MAGDDDRILATWRMDRRPGLWRTGDRITLERIEDHRRVYLECEGPLGDGKRGRVDRVDEGQVSAMAWTERYALLEVRLGGFVGRVELSMDTETDGAEGGRADGVGRWTAVVLERRGGADMMR